MDKTLVCGTETPGSIPGESTNENSPIGLFSFVLSPDAVFAENVA